jgi:hypothetical protein
MQILKTQSGRIPLRSGNETLAAEAKLPPRSIAHLVYGDIGRDAINVAVPTATAEGSLLMSKK